MSSEVSPTQPLQQLYAAPPAQFIALRDALAKALRRAGDAALGEKIAKLRKPSAAQWAVNQLSRARPQEVALLLSAADQLRRAHTGAAGLREAMQAHRAALRALVDAAGQALSAAGIHADHARAIEQDLQAATAGDDELRAQLREGRLTGDLQSAGFDALAGLAIPDPPRPAAPAPAPAHPHALASAPASHTPASGVPASVAPRTEAKKDTAAKAARRVRARELARAAVKLEQAAAKLERAAEQARTLAARRRGEAAQQREAAEAARAAAEAAEQEAGKAASLAEAAAGFAREAAAAAQAARRDADAAAAQVV